MSNIYPKWRDLVVDPFDIKYNNIKIKKIVSYLPAGNDVIECLCEVKKITKNVFIKIERSKICDFTTEVNNLSYLKSNSYYFKIPNIIEHGIYNGRKYIVLSKIEGEKLSDIFNADNSSRNQLLFKYGCELAKIHKIPTDNLNIAKQRVINSCPNEEVYSNLYEEEKISKYISFLKKNDFDKNLNTFIHGDFHYGNILWLDDSINGVVDWEYSGIGLKEQDIAWACILRPGQKFMDKKQDIESFLSGYLSQGKYDDVKLKWCLVNGYCHFYLMNKNNDEYRDKVLELLNFILNDNDYYSEK